MVSVASRRAAADVSPARAAGPGVPLATVVRRSGLALADQGVVSAASFLTALLIARTASPAELGRYTVALTIVLLLVEVQNSLIATPYTVAWPRLDGVKRAEHTGNVTGLQLCLAAAGAAALLTGALFLQGGAAGIVAMAGAALVPLLLREHLRRVSIAAFELGVAVRLDVLVAALQLAGIAALAAAGRLGATSAFAVTGVAAAVGAWGWLGARRGTLRLSWQGSRRAAPEVWRAGRWVLASGVVWAVGLHAAPWLLAAVRGSAEVGLWAAGMGLAALANPVLSGLANYLAPATAHRYAAGGAAGLGAAVGRAAATATLLVLPLLVGALAWGERLVALVYGASFDDTGLLVFLLTLHLWMTAVAVPISRALFTLERADVELRANLAGLALMGVLGVWLVGVYGAVGGALALAVAGAGANAVRAVIFRRLLRTWGA